MGYGNQASEVLEQAITLNCPERERQMEWPAQHSTAKQINAHFLLFNGIQSTHIRIINKASEFGFLVNVDLDVTVILKA